MQRKIRMFKAEVLVILFITVSMATSYKVGFGGCPPVKPMKDFQPAEFQGLWYVVEMFSTNSKCVTLTFDRLGKHDFRVTEGKEYVAAQVVGIDHAFQTKGVYNSRAPHYPAKFHARWSNNIFGAAEAIIVDTDYWQYAVLVECQSVMYFMKRTSASILSRRRDLDLRVLSQVKRDLCDSYGFDCSDFEAIDHNRCASTKREVVKKIEARASPLSNPKPLRRFPMPEVARTTPSTKTNMRTFRPVTQKPTSAPVTPRVYGKLQKWCFDFFC
ncbi:uncharacterized protein LOC122262295 [Penaeus japonicus]|uniref:uncharacterized protein LOC122262295 n=1 Tax=Penaeus japonicus TaxID=27405 RepID=UPI001C7153DC|nr:uncharacterized protein LOC122262295 [Penaeus japonicus]